MQLLQDLPVDKLTPSRLWSRLDPETRRLAAKSLYDSRCTDDAGRAEADRAIAAALRFREASVRRLAVDRRIDYLARAARPDDSLASSLLLALHLLHRRNMLSSFLLELDIPQDDGIIDADHTIDVSNPKRLSAAVATLRESYPCAEVELYLASLVAMDRETWGGLDTLLRERTG